MARDSFTEKTDTILGLANDIRNRVRRLLHHANINCGTDDSAITSIVVQLHTGAAHLPNGAALYETEEATMLTFTITRLIKKLSKY